MRDNEVDVTEQANEEQHREDYEAPVMTKHEKLLDITMVTLSSVTVTP